MDEIYLQNLKLKQLDQLQSRLKLKNLVSKEKKLKNPLKEYLYIISNPVFPNMFKIGITSNLKLRLCSYQTSDPYRRYKIEFSAKIQNARLKELMILEYYRSKSEWVCEDNIYELKNVVKFLIS